MVRLEMGAACLTKINRTRIGIRVLEVNLDLTDVGKDEPDSSSVWE